MSESPAPEPAPPPPVMTATYRLQLRPEFGFADAEALLSYLRRLGVSHLYLSPVTAARRGSTHGYDVVDHNEVSEALGGREGLDRLLEAAEASGLRVVLDWVPNHAGVGPRNAVWQDVLAYGPHSPSARYFDVDWDPLKPELRGKVLLPFLGRPYGEALEAGELGLAYDDGRFYGTYYESRFALSPASYALVLEAVLPQYERSEPYWDLKDLLGAYRGLGPGEREKAETLRPRLATLVERASPEGWFDDPDPAWLHDVLERQFWRLSHWLTAGHEINYRRFFDINELVGLRMEDAHVFWDAHRLLGELLAHPAVEGVRIDHVDGLFDPHGYLRRLKDLGAAHVWAEKILAEGERLPAGWPVEGTTGYEFMNAAAHLLLAPEGLAPLERAWRAAVPEARPWARTVYRSKELVMETALQSELYRLGYELDRLSEADYRTRDFTLEALRSALAEVVAAFDRYRTYLPHEPAEDRAVVEAAVRRARRRNPAVEPTVFAFIERVMLGEVRDDLRARQQAWVGRLQQYTAPVAAKGVEDTAFYRYVRLAALNEVGGEPDAWALSPADFHAQNAERAERHPRTLLATATHDHKRGEDTRARLVALAEVPDAWEAALAALAPIAERHAGEAGPNPADRYLFFQTLAALWAPPAGTDAGAYRADLPDRLWDYAQKAAREAKEQTSWINPDETYEAALERFVRGVTTDAETDAALGPLAADLARLGFANGLVQLVLKLTCPGVPDLYQGTELLDLSLVDPDNRRPVDYDRRLALLDEMGGLLDAPDAEALRGWFDGQDPRLKFFALARLLRLRNALPELFEGAYVALEPKGEGADRWVAFARTAGDAAVVVAVRRFASREVGPVPLPLPDGLPREWTDWFTGSAVGADDALSGHGGLPWRVLVAGGPGGSV